MPQKMNYPEATSELGAQNSVIEQLVAGIDAVVWECDLSLHLTYISPTVERILGYSAPACLDEANFWSRHLHPEDRDVVVAQFAAAAANDPDECDRRVTHRMLAADGQAIWVANLIRFAGHGSQRRMRGVLLEINERHRADD